MEKIIELFENQVNVTTTAFPSIFSKDDVINLLLELKDKNAKGLLKMTFDLNDLSEEMTTQLMNLSKSTRIVVEREIKKS